MNQIGVNSILQEYYICYVSINFEKIALFCTCIFSMNIALGQSNYEKNADRCFILFQGYEYSDSLMARTYADSGLHYALKTENNELKARAHQFRGWNWQDRSKFKQAKNDFYKSLMYMKRAGSRQGIADAYGNLGNAYLDMNEYVKSLKYQHLSLNANEKIIAGNLDEQELANAKEGRAYALHNICSIYQELKLYDQAFAHQFISIVHEIEVGNTVGVAISYNSLASLHKSLNNTDSAIYYFEKSLDIFRQFDSPNGVATTLQSYASLKNSGLSEKRRKEMILESLSISRKLGDVDSEAQTLINIGVSEFDRLSNDSLSSLVEKIYI